MPDAQPTTGQVDKEFANYIGELLQGAAKDVSETIAFFADQLKDQQAKHQELMQVIQRAESIKPQILKLEGNIEAATAAIHHFWSKERDPEQDKLPDYSAPAEG